MRFNRRFVLASLAALPGCGPRAGADPVGTIAPLYAPYVAKQNPPSDLLQKAPWTGEMHALLGRALAKSREDDEPLGAIDFDPIVDGQDWEITDLRVEQTKAPDGGRAEVTAHFKNFGENVTVTFDLKQEGGGWRVDNIRGAHWTLRQLLADDGITPETH